jgi:hypothetical protein
MTNASKGIGKQHSGGGRTPTRPNVQGGKPQTKIVSHSAAANIGIKKGNHASGQGKSLQRPADPLIKGKAPQVPAGNAVALNVGRGGPGAGRILHGQGGSQSGSAGHGANLYSRPATRQVVERGSAPAPSPMPRTPGGGPKGFGFPSKGR